LEEDNAERFVKQLRDTGSAERKAGSSRPRSACTDKNINLVDELVLSHEDAPQFCYSVIIVSYAGSVYQFLLMLKQFLQSYNKKFQGSSLV